MKEKGRLQVSVSINHNLAYTQSDLDCLEVGPPVIICKGSRAGWMAFALSWHPAQ